MLLQHATNVHATNTVVSWKQISNKPKSKLT